MQKSKKSNVAIMWLVSLYLFTPLLVTFIYSIFTEWMQLLPTGFTLKYYAQLFADSTFIQALLRTLVISVIPIFITMGILLLVMYVVIVYHPKWDKYLSIVCTIPYAIQGIILPVSIISLYVGAPGMLSNRVLLLIFTYCIIILPYMYQGLKNSLATIDIVRILEAAQLLGASNFYTFFKIIVPSISQALLISSLLSLAIIFGDFVIVNTIAGNHYTTTQVYLFRHMFSSGQFVSAIVVVLFFVTFLISFIAFRKSQKLERSMRKD